LALTGSVSILNPNNGYLLRIGRDTICSRISTLNRQNSASYTA
jgi:hypothetical protein